MNEFAASLRFIITVEVLGLVAWPLARHLFSRFPDKGWGLSKFLGILIVTWAVWLLSILRLVASPPGKIASGSIRYAGKDLLERGARALLS